MVTKSCESYKFAYSETIWSSFYRFLLRMLLDVRQLFVYEALILY